MDYRELLKKYMRHVVECEGVTFVRDAVGGEFSEGETAELKKIDAELYPNEE